MGALVQALRALEPFIYVAVAAAGTWRWFVLRTAGAAYAALSFVVLAAITVTSTALPDDTDELVVVRRLVVAVLALFPYLLFRFAGSFRPVPVILDGAAVVLTVLAGGGIFFVGPIPGPGEERSPQFVTYTLVIVVQWLLLSSYVIWALWAGGTGRPTVTRRRMRTLALGAAGMALAIVLAVAGQGGDDAGPVQLAVALIACVAAPLFLFGVAPPRLVLESWRRRDEQALREAEIGLVAATTPEDVGRALLPHVARTAGSSAALLATADGAVVATHGIDPERAQRVAADLVAGRVSPGVVAAPLRSGWLAVLPDAFSPYFGDEAPEVLGRVGVMTDLALRRAQLVESERAAALDLERANAAMRQFVAVASHDLRTPIAIIRGFCTSVVASWPDVPDDEKRSIFETVDRQASHLSRIVDDLMVISRIDSGVIAPERHVIDVAPLVRSIVADTGHAAQTVISLDGLEVVADEDHLVRIVRNLVENAFLYGAPPLEIGGAKEGDDVVLRFRDHGGGVSPEFIPRLFERFARAASAADASKTGTGLGLSIVRGLARLGGGEAWFDASVDGGGACFLVRLPTAEQRG